MGYMLLCACMPVCLCAPACVYVLALDADIGGFEARSMGHGGCLSIYYLGLGPIDHFQERERERVSPGVSRERILPFDLEGQ